MLSEPIVFVVEISVLPHKTYDMFEYFDSAKKYNYWYNDIQYVGEISEMHNIF